MLNEWFHDAGNTYALMQNLVLTYGLKILGAILTLIIGFWLAKLVRKGLQSTMTRSKVDAILVSFIGHLVYYGILVFFIISALGKVGIQTASIIAVIGAAGLAIGLALQGSLSNFAAGVLIVIFRPFKVGDFIEGANILGFVEEIQILSTQLRTPDNKGVVIPNSQLMSNKIINYNAKPTRRVDMVFGISYGDSIPKAKEILVEVVQNHPKILKDPAPLIRVVALADSSVNFVVRPWVNTPDYWDVWYDLTETVKQRFDEADITIPFPQRDVHLYHLDVPISSLSGTSSTPPMA